MRRTNLLPRHQRLTFFTWFKVQNAFIDETNMIQYNKRACQSRGGFERQILAGSDKTASSTLFDCKYCRNRIFKSQQETANSFMCQEPYCECICFNVFWQWRSSLNISGTVIGVYPSRILTYPSNVSNITGGLIWRFVCPMNQVSRYRFLKTLLKQQFLTAEN